MVTDHGGAVFPALGSSVGVMDRGEAQLPLKLGVEVIDQPPANSLETRASQQPRGISPDVYGAYRSNMRRRLAEHRPDLPSDVLGSLAELVLDCGLYNTLCVLRPGTVRFDCAFSLLEGEEKERHPRSPLFIYDRMDSSLDTLVSSGYDSLKARIGDKFMRGRRLYEKEMYDEVTRRVAYIVFKNTPEEVTMKDAYVAAVYLVNNDKHTELLALRSSHQEKEYLRATVQEYKERRGSSAETPTCVVLARLERGLFPHVDTYSPSFCSSVSSRTA